MTWRILFSALALTSLGLTGCERNKGELPGNQMPLTYLSIVNPGPTDTTNYRKVLHWWGTDPDGKIAGYLIRWDGGWTSPTGTETVYRNDTYWLTTATQDTFNVPVDGTWGTRSFTVRAVDEEGLVDSLGATQSFQLSNYVPHIRWNPDLTLPDTSLAAISFGWNAEDFDGRETIRTFKLWIDDDSLGARTVSDTLVSVRPEDFPGDRADGEHTIHVMGIDDALTPTPEVLRHTWFVKWPKAGQDWLLLRQYSADGQLDRWDRKVYQAILAEVAGGMEHVYTIDRNTAPDFATASEIEPLFSLFKGVAWLTGPFDAANDARMARNLRTAEKGMRAYIVDGGGAVLLIGQSVIGTDGALSSSFVKNDLGIPRFYRKLAVQPGEVTTTSIQLTKDSYVFYGSGSPPDSIKAQSSSGQVDFFQAPLAPGTGRYWVPPGALKRMNGRTTDPAQDSTAAYFAVGSQLGLGRIAVVTSSYARLFPNPGAGDPQPQDLDEGIRFFREALIALP